MPAAAHISHDSDRERPIKLASRKHSIHTHFPKDQNCEVCERTQITRAPCRRRNGEPVFRAEKFGYMITADHKVLNEGCESRNNHRNSVVVQDLQFNGFNLIRAKQTLLRRRKRVSESSWSQRGSQKSFVLTTHWNWRKLVKTYHGIIVLQHSIDPRRMELPKEQCAEEKEGMSAVLSQAGLDEKWLPDSMECCCHLRNVQDLMADGKTPHERRFGEPFKGPVMPFRAIL